MPFDIKLKHDLLAVPNLLNVEILSSLKFTIFSCFQIGNLNFSWIYCCIDAESAHRQCQVGAYALRIFSQ